MHLYCILYCVCEHAWKRILPLSLSERWGWLLTELGSPCVAQRVWARPKCVRSSSSRSSESFSEEAKKNTQQRSLYWHEQTDLNIQILSNKQTSKYEYECAWTHCKAPRPEPSPSPSSWSGRWRCRRRSSWRRPQRYLQTHRREGHDRFNLDCFILVVVVRCVFIV